MLEERDERAPAWAWLRGFAHFLLAWPLLSLLAAKELDFSDWESIVIAVLGPAAIGLVLLGLETALTRAFGRRAALRQPVPSALRDLANLGVAIAVLLVIDVGLVTLVDDDPMFRGGDPRAATAAWSILVYACAAALAFGGLARLVHGPARVVDLGAGWERAPRVVRFLGYLTLIPTLLVCTVMIDYTIHGRPDFGLVAWIVLPALLWLGLRSAMARAPRWWAKDPWEAWLRGTSLALPWWTIALAVALGFAALCVLAPFGLIDETMTTGWRIAAGVVLLPLGLIVLAGAGLMLVRAVPSTIRQWRAARRLARGADAVVRWQATGTAGQVRVTLRGGGAVVFEAGEDVGAMTAWLAGGSKDGSKGA